MSLKTISQCYAQRNGLVTNHHATPVIARSNPAGSTDACLASSFVERNDSSPATPDLRLLTEASILRVCFSQWRKIATRLFFVKRPAGQAGRIQGQASG